MFGKVPIPAVRPVRTGRWLRPRPQGDASCNCRLGGSLPGWNAPMSLATPASAPCTPFVPAGAPDAAAGLVPVPARRGEAILALSLRHAGRRTLTLRYEIVGREGLPAVVVAGGISAHRHVGSSARFPGEGWWECQVGAGRALDPARHQLIAIDWLGADGSLDAVIDPADQADAIAALLDTLAIARLHAFVGSSYGAMVGLQFAARHGA